MKETTWILLTFLLLALVAPLLGRLDSQFFAPDIALLTALFVGSRSTLGSAIVVGFATGLLKDGFSLAAPVGLYTEINVLAVLAARLLERRVDLRSPVPLMATAAGASLAATLLFLILEAIFHRSFEAWGEVVRMALPLALITMLVAPVHFALFDRVTRRFDAQQRGLTASVLRTRNR
jgi:rod shape-determining protein MreD